MNSDSKRAILAVALSGIVLFAWNKFFAPPPVVAPPAAVETSVPEQVKTVEGNKAQGEIKEGEAASEEATAETEKPITQIFTLDNQGHEFQIDNHLRVLNAKNPNQVRTFNETVEGGFGLFLKEARGGLKPLNFNFEQLSANKLSGRDAANGIQCDIEMDDLGRVKFLLTSREEKFYAFNIESKAKELEGARFRELVTYTKDSDRFEVGEADKQELNLKWFGIDFDYHILATIFEPGMLSNVELSQNGVVNVDALKGKRSLEFNLVYTKKEYGLLKTLGGNLQNSVDFGFFGIVAVFILHSLQEIYNWIPNYGWAIVIVTFLIRLVLFPLQFKSIKSMKKMQKIQPELTKIREKYKDDQQAIQRETMDLFKKSGANPLGGCLPLILQMPVFFAFYQVLYSAVELVEAPFIFWITDLSIKDPYYVLPILMGVTFFLQTKLNPTPTADPTQKKIMMFMPLVFTFIMKDLPAGLNLYFTVSTLFGIGQQLAVYKLVKE
ncbi:MAG: membrane protein insertase YidC [Bacteriovoracaceae bacterium]